MNCIGMNIADGEAGKWSMSQLWNPATSCKNLEVSSLSVAFTTQTASTKIPADLVHSTTPLGTISTAKPYNKDFGSEDKSKAEFRSLRVEISSQTGVPPIYEIWPGAIGSDKPYKFDPPLILPPGHGLHVRGAEVSTWTITSWQWREVDA